MSKKVKAEEKQQDPIQQEVSDGKTKALLLDMTLAESLIGYLRSKPMNEVEGLVNALAQSQQVTVTKK